MVSRRDFLELALAAGVGAGLARSAPLFAQDVVPTHAQDFAPMHAQDVAPSQRRAAPADDLEVHIFSKHLQFLDYPAMAEAAAELGFDGVDLTVRPGGHVEPERARDDLPRAVLAVRQNGLKAEMMTTAIDDASDSTSRIVLETAADLRIRYYRMNWYRHPEDGSLPQSLDAFRARAQDLAALNRELGIRGGYQNHAGNYVGASIWELWALIQDLDPDWLGCQYDIRHATIEGGLSWPQGLRLIRPYIHTIIAKDVRWSRDGDDWRVEDVPLGQGMVDWERYFGLLAAKEIHVPLSLHLEYPIGGAEHGGRDASVDRKVAFEAMRRDLAAVRTYWREAQSG